MQLPPRPRIVRNGNSIILEQRRKGWGARAWVLIMRRQRSDGWRCEWYNDGEVTFLMLGWGKPREQSRFAMTIYFYVRSA